MAGWTKFIDMQRDDEAMLDAAMPFGILSKDIPQYPPGLRICLCEDELDKLDLEQDMELGDIIDLRAMARVTSVSSDESSAGKHRRVELQITSLAVESEDQEEPGEE